jgi:hypothetical protein
MEGEAMIKKFHTTPFETSEARLAASQLPKAERQELIENLLVTYPVFDEMLEFIGSQHGPVDGGRHGRGYVAGMMGKTRAGTSDVVK